MKQKVLFLGCNTDQLPYLLSIQKLGFFVVATDRNPEAPGVKLADKFYNVGYTDAKGLKQVAISEKFTTEDKIFTTAYHFAYEAASEVAEYLGMPYISKQTVDICLNKFRFYEFLKDIDIPIPQTQLFDRLNFGKVDSTKIYYLKSDYGKSSRFCHRIVNGEIPPLPSTSDMFFRKVFLLQEEVRGVHYRLNFYSGQVSVFLKFKGLTAVGLPSLGLEHKTISEKLSKAIEALGLISYLVKFDLIINESGWYVIDIGLDPPFRLRLLCSYLGIDFEMAYTRHYLLNDWSALPAWSKICRPVLMLGTPQAGFTFTELGDDIYEDSANKCVR